MVDFQLDADWWTSVSWWRVLCAILVVAAALGLSNLVGVTFKTLRERYSDSAPKIYIVEKLTQYAIVLVSLFAGLWILGINLTSLTVFAGAVGVGLGLG